MNRHNPNNQNNLKQKKFVYTLQTRTETRDGATTEAAGGGQKGQLLLPDRVQRGPLKCQLDSLLFWPV